MLIRRYDRSGQLIDDAFFEVETPVLYRFNIEREWGERVDDWLVFRPDQDSHCDYAYVEVAVHSTEVRHCLFNQEHVTAWQYQGAECMDAYGGGHLLDIVPDTIGQSFVVRSDFVHRLAASGLLGFEIEQLPVLQNQSRCRDLTISRLKIKGRNIQRRPTIAIPQPNACPFCKSAPIVCLECQDITHHCPECEQSIVVLERDHEGPNDLRHSVEPAGPETFVFEAERWDGSDFLENGQVCVISKRALNWLVEQRATAFVAKPCHTDIEKLEGERRRHFEQMLGRKI